MVNTNNRQQGYINTTSAIDAVRFKASSGNIDSGVIKNVWSIVMALTKFNFNSFDVTTVASTALAFNSSANGFDTVSAGAMTLIVTNTISSGVSSSFITSGINSTYDIYLFKFINIHPATVRDEFQLNFRDGGSKLLMLVNKHMFMTYIMKVIVNRFIL